MQRKCFKRVAVILLLVFALSISFSSIAMASGQMTMIEWLAKYRPDGLSEKETTNLEKNYGTSEIAKLDKVIKTSKTKTTTTKKFSQLTTDEKNQVLNEKLSNNEISFYVVVDGKEYLLNEILWKEKGIIAYGDSEEISKNENSTTYEAIKDGKSRYLGYDINGNIYTNSEFGDDVGSSKNSQNKNWLTLDDMKGNKGASNLIHYDFLDNDKFSKDDKINTAEKYLEQNPDWVSAGWTAKQIVDTFKFNQVTDDSGLVQGSFVGTHKTSNGKVYYNTFTVERGDPSYLVKTNNGKKAEFVEVAEIEVEKVKETKVAKTAEKSVYKATITVNGVTKNTGDLLYSKSFNYTVSAGESKTITYTAKGVAGYNKLSPVQKLVTITSDKLTETVIFEYDFIPVQHEDQHSYHSNIDVITSVIIKATNGDITNDDKAYIKFYVNGEFVGTKELVQPNGSEQLAYMKWHTPSYATNLTMTVYVTGNASARIVGGVDEVYGAGNYSRTEVTIPVQIINLYEHTPPNPEANDRPEDEDYFHQP